MNNYNFTWLEKASYLLKNVRGLLVPIKLVAHVKKNTPISILWKRFYLINKKGGSI